MRKKTRIAVLAALAFSVFAILPGLPLLLAQSDMSGERDTLLTDYKRDLVITGNVVMADGSPPPQPVAIQLVCASNAQQVAKTDTKGFFNFQLAQQLPSIPDAGGSSRNVYPARPVTSPDAGGLGIQPAGSANVQSTPLACEFRALLTGFRSTSVKSITLQRQNTVVNVGTIVLLRTDNQGGTISSTSMSAPLRARRAYEKAYAHLRKRDFSGAQRELEQAVKQYPQYAAAWTDLGRLHAQQNRFDQARQAFMQARQADERFVPAYIGLASIALRQSQWTEAQELSSRATQLGGAESPLGFYYNAVANFQLGQWDNAEKSARAAARFDTRLSPQVKLLLGSILGAKGDYAAAAEEFKSYLKLLPTAANADQVRQHIAELEKLAVSPPQAQQASAGTAVVPRPKFLELAVSTDVGAAGGMAALADLGESFLSWAPPDLDEVVPPVSAGVPCPLEEVVSGISLHAKQLMDNLQQFSATERIEHVKLGKGGNGGGLTSATAKYVAEVRKDPSGALVIVEYHDGTISHESLANMTTTGIAGHALMFHPALIDDLAITCEGLGNVRGQPAWQLHFAQRPDRPARFRAFLTPRGGFAVPLRGRAWAAADNYHVVRMETDLAKPIDEIALRKDYIIIDYRPVEFPKRHVELWLPETVDLYLDLLGQRSHRQHSFSGFELFWVETAEKTKEPEVR